MGASLSPCRQGAGVLQQAFASASGDAASPNLLLQAFPTLHCLGTILLICSLQPPLEASRSGWEVSYVNSPPQTSPETPQLGQVRDPGSQVHYVTFCSLIPLLWVLERPPASLSWGTWDSPTPGKPGFHALLCHCQQSILFAWALRLTRHYPAPSHLNLTTTLRGRNDLALFCP